MPTPNASNTPMTIPAIAPLEIPPPLCGIAVEVEDWTITEEEAGADVADVVTDVVAAILDIVVVEDCVIDGAKLVDEEKTAASAMGEGKPNVAF